MYTANVFLGTQEVKIKLKLGVHGVRLLMEFIRYIFDYNII